MRKSLVATLLTAATVAACASGAAAGAGAPGGSTYVVTAEEIQQSQVSTAFDAIQRLRPQWLFDRGTSSIRESGPEGQPVQRIGDPITDGPVVFVNGTRAGAVSVLRNIPAELVQEMRFLRARDATTKYGTGYPQGVIEVIRK